MAYGKSKGVGLGWYQNDCGCTETVELQKNYAGDIRQLDALGFTGVKYLLRGTSRNRIAQFTPDLSQCIPRSRYDNCAVMRNMTEYARLMNATGKSFLIENCHWGVCTDDDTSSCPTRGRDWCPFNFFRTSGDIRGTWNSFVRNLLTTVPFLDKDEPLSGPHCWAYPDMLQVGNLQSYAHDRANFGSCKVTSNPPLLVTFGAFFDRWLVITGIIISAPLYLSFDLRDDAKMERVWPLVTNREALAISQQYAGHPGRLVKSWTPDPELAVGDQSSSGLDSDRSSSSGSAEELFVVTADLHSCQHGWSYDNSTGQISLRVTEDEQTKRLTGCITVPVGGNASLGSTYYDDAALVLRPCTSADPAQRFERKGDSYTCKYTRNLKLLVTYGGGIDRLLVIPRHAAGRAAALYPGRALVGGSRC